MFSHQIKSEDIIEFIRTLPKVKKSTLNLYLFPSAEVEHLGEIIDSSEWNARPLDTRYRIFGIPEDKKQLAEQNISLLSPYYETLRSTWLANFQRSLEKIKLQIQQTGLTDQLATRLLNLCRAFAKRIRSNTSEEPKQARYQRQLDIYFSWVAEQSFLPLPLKDEWQALNPEIKQEILDFLSEEQTYRKHAGYTEEIKRSPARNFYRMHLYQRLLDRFILLKGEAEALGSYVKRTIKALITTLVMSAFTIFIFYYRDSGYTLSLSLIVTVAMVYALRDLLRDDLNQFLTNKILQGKPLWKIKYKKSKKQPLLFQQYIWRSIQNYDNLPEEVKRNSGNWYFSSGKNVFHMQFVTEGEDYLNLAENIEESLEINFKPFTSLISNIKNPVYEYSANDQANDAANDATSDEKPLDIATHLIEQRHYYNLVLVTEEPDTSEASTEPAAANPEEDQPVTANQQPANNKKLKKKRVKRVQRWKLTLAASGVVECTSAKVAEN